MNWKKFGNRTLALFMAFCLLFACAAPARAAETGGTWATVSIPADVGVSSVMNGLGVLPGESPDAYDGIVERCVDYLTEQGRVVAGKIDAWKREQVEGTPWAYGIDVSIIDVIRAWLYDEKIVDDLGQVKNQDHYEIPITYYGGKSSVVWSSYPVSVVACLTYEGGSNQYGIYAIAPKNVVVDVGLNQFGSRTSFVGTTFNYVVLTYFSGVTPGVTPKCSFPVYDDYISNISINPVSGGVITEYDVKLGKIGALSIPLSEVYPIWYGNSIAVPPIVGGGSETEDDVVVYPIAPGDTLADTQSKTQEDVWAGAGTITDAPAIPDTVTLADVLSAIVSIPGDIVEGIGKLFFPDVGAFEISLSDFFPFCIPYDIFEFFTLLRAEPEAPVFHWEIPVPQLGQTFDIDVDLSAWDEVAELFRTLELLAFIVGLAYVTREKFLRS